MLKLSKIILFMLLTSCAGQTGWHIGLKVQENGKWIDVDQSPEVIIIKAGNTTFYSKCLPNTLLQYHVLSQAGIKDFRYIVVYYDNGIPGEIHWFKTATEAQIWYDNNR